MGTAGNVARKWQILSITALADERYDLLYLLDGNEKRHVITAAPFGLDHAIKAHGILLSLMPPMVRPPIGEHKSN